VRYGKIPDVRKPISRLVQGTIYCSTDRQEESDAILDAVFARGVNTFDTAHIYGGGKNERAVGAWMNRRGLREQVVLIAKGCHHTAERRRVTPFDLSADLHDALARFDTDYVDIFLLHRDDPDVPVGPIVERLNELKAEGKVGAFGGSNWTHRRIAEANEYAEKHGLTPFTCSSPNFSLAEQIAPPWDGCITISGPQNAEARRWYAEHGVALFTWSSLANGFFSGRLTRENFSEDTDLIPPHSVKAYACEANFKRLDRAFALAAEKGLTVAQVALAWVLNQPMNVYALVASRTPEEADANVAAVEVALTEAERAWLNLERDVP